MKRFDIIVFNQNDHNGNSWLSIGYLSSALREEHVDCHVSFFLQDEINLAVEYVLRVNPIAVGVPMLQYNFYTCLAFCKELKSKSPKTFVILGNKEATCYYDYLLNVYHDYIDAISLGEGEDTLIQFCHCIINDTSFGKCPGLAIYSDKQVILTPKRKLRENIDTFPFPDRSYRIGNSNVYNVLGSRGCQGNCSFCEANTIYKHNEGPRVRQRTINNILDEIETLSENHSIIHINFIDSTFCGDSKQSINRLNELYESLIKRDINIQFGFNIRSEQVNQEFVDCLLKLETVGLVSILIGLEAGNKEDLELYNKCASLDVHKRTLRLLRDNDIISGKAGIHFETGFINFNPYTTLERLRENLDFLESNSVKVSPYDMTSRLMISGSCYILNRIREDGLLTIDPSLPVVNPYGYRFMDPKAKHAYDMYNKYLSMLGIKNYENVLFKKKIFIRHFSSICIDGFDDIYQEYNNYSNNAVIFVINTILNILEEKTTDYKLLPKIRMYKEKILEMEKMIEWYDNIMSKRLYRINQLII